MRSRLIGVVLALGAVTLAAAQNPQTGGGRGGDGGQGGQTSANMEVNANVVRKCTISAQALGFGSYDPVLANASAPLDAQSTLTVACTKGTAVSIAMDNGSNAQGNTRRMAGSLGAYLTYNVYRDPGHTQPWGDSESDRFDAGVAPSREPRQFIVYGRVPGSQDVPEGAFRDTVLVTVEF